MQEGDLPNFIASNGLALQYLQEKSRTLDLCLAATLQNLQALSHVPKNLLDQVILKLAEKNLSCLKKISKEFFSKELLERIIRENHQAAEYFPTMLLTDSIVMEILQRQDILFEGTALAALSYTILQEMTWKNPSKMLDALPKEVQKKLIFDHVVEDPKSFRDVHFRFLSPELVEEIVEQNKEALTYLSRASSLPKACDLIVKMVARDVGALLEIPIRLLRHETLEALVKEVPEAFRALPIEWIRDVLTQDIQSLEVIPPHLLSYELIKEVAHQNAKAISHAPEKFREELIKDLVIEKPECFRVIWPGFLSFSLLKEIVRKNPQAIVHMPQREILPSRIEVAIELIKEDRLILGPIARALPGRALFQEVARQVPEAFQVLPEEILEELISQNPNILKDIPRKYLSRSLITQVIERMPWALKFIQKSLS